MKLRLEEITTTRLTDARDKAVFVPPGLRRGVTDRDYVILSVISGPNIGTARVASTGF